MQVPFMLSGSQQAIPYGITTPSILYDDGILMKLRLFFLYIARYKYSNTRNGMQSELAIATRARGFA